MPADYYLRTTESSDCYKFTFHGKKRGCEVYKCAHCCKEKWHNQIDLIDDEFQEDPCKLPHKCIPKSYSKNHMDRSMYENFQKIRNDPDYFYSSLDLNPT
ncbi:unnamed protein product [Cylicocyclus nassatus]|uniref:Uncharacterized protein n=1 Tax=Cylicocyclus nassatus TaxID=53992 RepID=A0AA36GUV0_CYLNA|nr:unnamed protein product [Cylicocyclus nassatus]